MIKKYIKKRPKTNHFRHPRLNIIPDATGCAQGFDILLIGERVGEVVGEFYGQISTLF